jgi:pyruvyl transferase EpsO
MLDVLRPHVDPPRPAALLDFPNHSNVGDSAIWLGELAWLRSLGVSRLAYQGEAHLHNPARLARVIADGPIFLHGGGNFGDLWPAHQRFRERIVEAFPDNAVVFLPQTVHFRDRRNLERAAERLNRHRRLTIFVRDRHSLDTLAPMIDAPVVACPDPALFLSLASRRKPPLHDFLLLARTDLEAPDDTRSLAAAFPTTDWLEEPLTPQLRYFRIV